MDFIGISKKIGPVGIGISRKRGYKWGVEMDLYGTVTGDFHPKGPIKLKHSDHPNIPKEDTILLYSQFNGRVSINTQEPLKIEYSSTPIFIGAGLGFGEVKLGVGFKFIKNRIFGDGNLLVSPFTFSVFYNDTTSGWTIDSLYGYAVINDTLFYGKTKGDINSNQSAFNLGIILDKNIIKFSMAYEYGTCFNLNGNYEWIFSWMNDFPENFQIDTSGILIDSVNNIISGNFGIIFNDVPKDLNSEIGYTDLYFTGYHSIRVGVQLNFSFLKMGLSGAADRPISSDISLSRLDAGLSFRIPTPFLVVNMGFAGSLMWLGGTEIEEWLKLEEGKSRFIPSATTGLSINYKYENFRIDFPVKFNITQYILSKRKELKEEEISFNLWENISVGLGIGISF